MGLCINLNEISSRSVVMGMSLLVFASFSLLHWEKESKNEMYDLLKKDYIIDAAKMILAGTIMLIPTSLAIIFAGIKQGSSKIGLITLFIHIISTVLLTAGNIVYIDEFKKWLDDSRVTAIYCSTLAEFVIIGITSIVTSLDHFRGNILDDNNNRGMTMSTIWFALFGFCAGVCNIYVSDKTKDGTENGWACIGVGYLIVSFLCILRIFEVFKLSDKMKSISAMLLAIGGIILANGYWAVIYKSPKESTPESRAKAAWRIGVSLFMLIIISANAFDMYVTEYSTETVELQTDAPIEDDANENEDAASEKVRLSLTITQI